MIQKGYCTITKKICGGRILSFKCKNIDKYKIKLESKLISLDNNIKT